MSRIQDRVRTLQKRQGNYAKRIYAISRWIQQVLNGLSVRSVRKLIAQEKALLDEALKAQVTAHKAEQAARRLAEATIKAAEDNTRAAESDVEVLTHIVLGGGQK